MMVVEENRGLWSFQNGSMAMSSVISIDPIHSVTRSEHRSSGS